MNTLVVERRADAEAFKKEVRSDIKALRETVRLSHAETVSNRVSVNANSRHMIEMCETITEQYKLIAEAIETNTTVTIQTAAMAKKALDLSEKMAKDNEGLFEFYQTSKKTVHAVQRATVKSWLTTKIITLKASKTSRALIPIISLAAIALAWYRGEPLHFKDVRDILEALK